MKNSNAATMPHEAGAHKPPLKWCRVLRALLEGPHTSFELEKAPVFDHSPNSTVSELRKRGLDTHSVPVVVPGYGGAPTRIAEYSLDPSSRSRAEALLRGES